MTEGKHLLHVQKSRETEWLFIQIHQGWCATGNWYWNYFWLLTAEIVRRVSRVASVICRNWRTVWEFIQKEQLLLAVPKNYSVNTRLQEYQIPIEEIRNGQFRSSHIPSVPLNKFENEPFIILRSDNDTGKRALTICQENHFSPSVVFRLDQQMTAYNIACLGMGITFIGDLLLSRVPTNSELVFYKLPGQSSKRTVFFYWKKGRYISRAMEEFLKLPFSWYVIIK